MWIDRNPSLADMRPWGPMGHVMIPHPNKIEPKTIWSIFVRYSELSKGYVMVHKDQDARLIEVKSRDID